MNTERFGRRMVALLPQLVRGFARRESNYLSRGKITLPQLWAMEQLSRQQELPMSGLARSLRITRPAATGLINRLIAQGLASRAGDSRDRRVVRVALTAKGRKALSSIWEQKSRMMTDVFGRIPAQDRTQYLNILEKVARVLSEEGR